MSKTTVCQSWEGDSPLQICSKEAVAVVKTTCTEHHISLEVYCIECLTELMNRKQDCTVCYIGSNGATENPLTTIAAIPVKPSIDFAFPATWLPEELLEDLRWKQS